MTRLYKRITFFVMVALCSLFSQKSFAQTSILNPSDPVVEYNSNNPPTAANSGELKKWVRTTNTAVHVRNDGKMPGGYWNTDVYKAYNYDGLAFRLRFPNTYIPDVADGKKYPLIIFFHGKGEIATYPLYQWPNNFDNEFQLLQGPPEFDLASMNGIYDGYVLAPQVTDLFFDGDFDRIIQIVDYMIAHNKVDPFHIVVNGLSGGGTACWQMLNRYPLYISSATPMSAPTTFVDWNNTGTYFFNKRFTPIWCSQGDGDHNPSPEDTKRVADTMAKYGANFKESYYFNVPVDPHWTWYPFWGEPDFWPFINRSYMSNPWMIGGLKNFRPAEPVSGTIGVPGGFSAYQWRLNGNLINGATANTLNVTAPGLYEAKVQKADGTSSEWSHVPINIRSGFYEAETWIAKSTSPANAPTSDEGGGQYVGFIGNGDWMDYTIDPYVSGTFTLLLRVAAKSDGGKIEVRDANNNVLAIVNVPATGDYEKFETISTTVQLPQGAQTIRLQSASSVSWNINWMQFLLSSQSPLPVKFVYFNSQCKGFSGNRLEWRTAQEQNTVRFSVQKSTDGVNWTEVSTVAAAGQSTQERSYTFEDRTAAASTNLYRIVEYDMNGRTTISSIIRSNCSLVGSEINLYPNPSSGSSALNISLQQATKLTLRVVDSKGSVVQQRVVQLPAGSSTVPLNMSSYPNGVYTLDAQLGSERKTIKLIKK
jgi:hypothetical protein